MYKMELYVDGSFSAGTESESLGELISEIDELYAALNAPQNIESVYRVEIIILLDNKPFNSFLILFNPLKKAYELRSERAWKRILKKYINISAFCGVGIF